MNDIAVTDGLMTGLLGHKPSHHLKTAKLLIDGWHAHKLLPCISDMNTAWETFRKQKPFWQ